MKHKINLRLMEMKKTEVFYEGKNQRLFHIHDLQNKKQCKTLHPVTIQDLSLESRRVANNYNNIKENMYSIIEKYKVSNDEYKFPRLEIPVAFHIIYPPGKENDPEYNLPDDVINNQLSVLNGVSEDDPGFNMSLPGHNTNGYTKSGFHFYNYHPENKAYSRTEDYNWFYKTETFEPQMKEDLCIEPEHVINVFYANAEGYLGWAYFPDDFPENDKMHGVVINHKAILGGSLRSYSYGKTLLHEMGHHFGLYHTFQGGCYGEDGCNDTPSQDNGNNIYDCSSLNTCPNQEGDDPYNNYMNYVDDYCMTRFTDEQIYRIWAHLETYKPLFLQRNIIKQEYNELNISLYKGWNLFYIPEYDEQNLDLTSIKTYMDSDIFTYDNGYKTVTNFSNGNSYWIKLNSNIDLKFNYNLNENNKKIDSNSWYILTNYNDTNLKNDTLYYEFDNKNKVYIKTQTPQKNKCYWVKT